MRNVSSETASLNPPQNLAHEKTEDWQRNLENRFDRIHSASGESEMAIRFRSEAKEVLQFHATVAPATQMLSNVRHVADSGAPEDQNTQCHPDYALRLQQVD